MGAPKKPIVVFAPQPWNAPTRQRPQHLALALARRGHAVTYVEPGGPPGRREAAPNLEVIGEGASGARRHVSSLLGTLPGGEALRRRIQSLDLYRRFRRTRAAAPPRADAPGVVLVQFPYFAPQALALQQAGWHLVYDRLDPWAEMPGVGETPVDFDASLYARASRVSVTHARLGEGPRGLSRPTTLVPNGVDLEHFKRRTGKQRPPELPADRSIAGYVGTIGPWFDWPRLLDLARKKPGWYFPLIGPGTVPGGLPDNVAALGPRDYSRLPDYLQHFHVGLVPFRAGPLRDAVDPVKAYEYLAVGLPVLANEFEALRGLPGVTLSDGDWPPLLDAVASARPDRRQVRRALQPRSWSKLAGRVAELFEAPDPGPALSVVVPSYNGKAHLQRCLDSLQAQTVDDLEVIVVDDASTDGSSEAVREAAPSTRLIERPSNGGFAAAANDGLRAARGSVIALLNNDAEVAPGWAAALLVPFADPGVGSVASYLLRSEQRDRVDRAGDGYAVSGAAFNRLHNQQDARIAGHTEEIFGASAAAAAYRRAALVEAGPLDESFDSYCEDVDLAWRLLLLGWRCVLAHDAVGWHMGNATYRPGGARCVRNSSRNSEVVFWSDLPAALLLRCVPEHLLFLLLQAAHRALRGELGPYLEGKLQFLGALPAVADRRRRIQRLRTVTTAALLPLLERRWIRSVIGGWTPSR